MNKTVFKPMCADETCQTSLFQNGLFSTCTKDQRTNVTKKTTAWRQRYKNNVETQFIQNRTQPTSKRS